MAVWRICEVRAVREFMKSIDYLEKAVQLLLHLAATVGVNVQARRGSCGIAPVQQCEVSRLTASLLQVYFCLSVSALTDVLEDLQSSHRTQVASILLKLLCCEHAGVYVHAVAGIYRVVEKGLCNQELLSPTTVQRLVQIASGSSHDANARQVTSPVRPQAASQLREP